MRDAAEEIVVMQLQNVPTSWAAFRALRQTPTPFVHRRHGNRKHGRYSKSSIAGMRMVRSCVRILPGGLSSMHSLRMSVDC